MTSAPSTIPAQNGELYDLVVSVVHYNTPELLARFLDDLKAEGSHLRVKTVVIDNASTRPFSAERRAAHPDVTFIDNPVNLGFGSANNQSFRRFSAKAYLVTNPDIRTAKGTLGPLLKRLHGDERLGALGVRLRYPDGRLQSSCRRYPTLRSVLVRGFLSEADAAKYAAIQKYMMADLSLDAPMPVDWVMGSCLLLKREALEKTRGFDEGFFMYYEDIDLCYRVRQAGFDVRYFPDVEWIHDYRRESAQKGKLKLRFFHFWSALRFLGKHLFERGLFASV